MSTSLESVAALSEGGPAPWPGRPCSVPAAAAAGSGVGHFHIAMRNAGLSFGMIGSSSPSFSPQAITWWCSGM